MAETLPRLTSKQPYDEYHITFPFADDLANVLGGATVSTAAVTAKDIADDSDVTATLLNSTKQRTSVDGNSVHVWVRAGTDGHEYQITCKIVATNTDQSKFEMDVILPVTEL